MQTDVSTSSSVVAVPYAQARGYFRHEIEKEGEMRKDVDLIIYFPEDRHESSSKEDIQWLLDALDKSRENGSPYQMQAGDFKVDVALVDIRINFHFYEHVSGPAAQELVEQNFDYFAQENLSRLNKLTEGVINDRMVLLSAIQHFDAAGEVLMHFHNVILGLWTDGEETGPLDMEPLIELLREEDGVTVVAPTNDYSFV